MAKFRRKPLVVEAVQWFKNGVWRTWTGEEVKANGWEGQIVRYFRRPDVSGDKVCKRCGLKMKDHGWIDTPEGGHKVCPGDFVITGVKGERYPCRPEIFAATYEPA